MAVNVTPEMIKTKYDNAILLRVTDDNKTGFINDSKIQKAIDRAKVTLSSWCDIGNTSFWTEANLTVWWEELTYYWLWSDKEREKVAQDKYDDVSEEIKQYREEKIKALNEADKTESIDNQVYSEDFLIPLDTIKGWK